MTTITIPHCPHCKAMLCTPRAAEIHKKYCPARPRVGIKKHFDHTAVKVRRHHTACKVGSRLVKLKCPGCGYVLRATRVWIATGVPTCHCGARFEVILGKVSTI